MPDLIAAQDFTARQLCIHCKGGECVDDIVKEDAMVICDCCLDHGAHLKCLLKNGVGLSSEEIANPSFVWFCSEACKRVATGLVEATNQRRRLEKSGIYTSEVVRYSEKYRSSQNVVGTVVSMFHSAFGPSQYADGSDLVELVCRGANHSIKDADDDEQPPDCSNFLNFILRKGGNIVAAAVIRAHGTLLAEIPFIVTKDGYRREGNCKRLLSALEKMLNDLGVQWLVVPAAEITVPIWIGALGFKEAPPEAIEQLEERIIVPDDTKILLKKVGFLPAPNTSDKRKKLKRVRFRLPRTAFDSTSESSDDGEDDNTAKKKCGKRLKKKSSDEDDEFTVEDAEAELGGDDDDDEKEEEEENEAGNGNGNGCSQCGTLSAKQLHENEETGDLLCNTCHSALGGSAAGHGGAPAGSGGKACYHCGNHESSKLHKHKDSGGWECVTCKRYRASHNGELRPARLFKRRARTTTASLAVSTGNGAAAGASGSTPLQVPTPHNQQQRQQQDQMLLNRSSLVGTPRPGNQEHRQAVAQKRAFRLQERFCSHSTQIIKYCTALNKNSSIMSTIKNSYNISALGNSANQVAIELLASKGVEDGSTAWGDLRRQVIKSDAARRRAEDILNANGNAQTAAGEELLEQERQKRAEVEAHNQFLVDKMKLMEEQFARQQEIIAALKNTNHSALAAPLATVVVSSPARTLSPPNLSPEDKGHALAEDFPLVERSMEDLIHDLGGGVLSTDEDDGNVATGCGGRYRGRLVLVQKKEGITPLKDRNTSNNVGRPTKVVSPCKQQNTSPFIEKEKAGVSVPDGEVRLASPAPASPLHSDPNPSAHEEEENTPPNQIDVNDDAHEGGGLFTLFRGLPRSGGGKEGEASGETMMADNESKSVISSGGEEEEGRKEEKEVDIDVYDCSHDDALHDGDVVKKEDLSIFHDGGSPKRNSLGVDGPQPFQSQSSNS